VFLHLKNAVPLEDTMKNVFARALILVVFLTLSLPAYAQLGSIVGKVIDKDGKPIGDATVTIEREEVKYKVEVKSDKGGNYSRMGLEDGTYRVTVKQGGNTIGADNVTVSLGYRAEKIFDQRSPQAASLPVGTISKAQRDAEQKANNETQGAFNAGMTALTARNYDEATKQFLLALERKPSPAIYNRLGETYVQAKKFEEATDAYKKATELKGDDPDYFNGLGLAAARASKFDVAKTAIQKSVDLDPGRASIAFLNLGMLLAEKGQDKDAIEALQKSIKANPKAADPYYELGMAYLRTPATMKEAAIEFEKYIQAAPKGDPKAATAKQLADAAKAGAT
jgi:tetratricopeptide (TPR) repeat protein